MRIPYISVLAAGALALGGCAYGDLGYGMGYGGGYSPYGYNSYGYGSSIGIGVGYGSGYGGYGYGNPYGYYGSGYGGYGGYSPFGWYDNYYYPGTGYYVYDSYRRPHVWSDTQRRYWSQRVNRTRPSGTTTTAVSRPNWSGFDRSALRAARQDRAQTRRTAAEQRRDDRRNH